MINNNDIDIGVLYHVMMQSFPWMDEGIAMPLEIRLYLVIWIIIENIIY